MNNQASIVVLVLPELFQLVHVHGLLIMAMFQQAYTGLPLHIGISSAQGQTQTRITEADSASESHKVQAPLHNHNTSPVFFGLTKLYNKNLKFKAYPGFIVTPVLQTEVVMKLMILCLICSAYLYLNTKTYNHAYGLIWDDLGRFMSVFLTLSACCALGLSVQAGVRFGRYEFTLILWLSLLGMLCLIKSYSFLAFYLSIELQSLSFYMLAAMRSRNEASAEAGLKYFILSAFSSAMLLLGMTLVYSTLGTMDFADLSLALNHFDLQNRGLSPLSVSLGLGCICVSLLFKLAAAPFHAWIADVYEGSHTSITAWFAITSKIAVTCALIRLNTIQNLTSLLTFASLLSLIVGSLSAARQVKLKRLLAFSAVANAGWFLLALNAGQWQLMVVHLIVYTMLSVNLFSIFILPLARTHPGLAYRSRLLRLSGAKDALKDHGADGSAIKYISDLHQMYRVNPGLALSLTLSMFSLAGIPPLAGFYSKYLILNALTQNENYNVLALALGVAVLSAFYYLRLIKTLYFSDPGLKSSWWFTVKPTPWNAYLASLSCGLTLVWFVKPAYFCVWLSLI